MRVGSFIPSLSNWYPGAWHTCRKDSKPHVCQAGRERHSAIPGDHFTPVSRGTQEVRYSKHLISELSLAVSRHGSIPTNRVKRTLDLGGHPPRSKLDTAGRQGG